MNSSTAAASASRSASELPRPRGTSRRAGARSLDRPPDRVERAPVASRLDASSFASRRKEISCCHDSRMSHIVSPVRPRPAARIPAQLPARLAMSETDSQLATVAGRRRAVGRFSVGDRARCGRSRPTAEQYADSHLGAPRRPRLHGPHASRALSAPRIGMTAHRCRCEGHSSQSTVPCGDARLPSWNVATSARARLSSDSRGRSSPGRR